MHLTCGELSSTAFINQIKLLTSRVNFAVGRYECLIENFSAINVKKNIELHQSFTGTYKQMIEKLEDIKLNKMGRKFFQQYYVTFKN